MSHDGLRRFVRRMPPGVQAGMRALWRWPREGERRRELRAFREAYAGRIDPDPERPPRGRVLVVGLLGDFTSGAIIEGFLAKSMQLAGLEPVFVSRTGAWANAYHAVYGLDRFVDLERARARARRAVDRADLERRMDSLDSPQALLGFAYRGIAIGKYVFSTLVRQTYRGSIDPSDPELRGRVSEALWASAVDVEAARAIFDELQPEAALFLERGYSPFGEFFDLAVARRLNVVQWCASHDPSRLMLKRYRADNVDRHPYSLSARSWETLRSMSWTEAHERRLHEELHGSYASGDWYAEVGTQFSARLMDREEVRRRLDLKPGRKLAVIFSHLFWDATLFWGEDLFDDYRHWFVETVRAATRNDSLDWIVKLHPANLVKLARDGYVGEPVEQATIRSEIGELPDHVRVLPADTPISAFSLLETLDYCVTVRGTVGIEAAVLGKAALTAGTGRYDGHGFTVDSDSRETYLGRLAELEKLPPPDARAVELARRFAYGSFLLRPFQLRTLRLTHDRDARATQRVEIDVASAEVFRRAPDVREFGAWAVDGRDEDYLVDPCAIP